MRGYEADLRRIIGRDVGMRTHPHGVVLILPCSAGHTVEHEMDKKLPPDALLAAQPQNDDDPPRTT